MPILQDSNLQLGDDCNLPRVIQQGLSLDVSDHKHCFIPMSPLNIVSHQYHSVFLVIQENTTKRKRTSENLGREKILWFTVYWTGIGASQVVLVVKNPPDNAGDRGLIPGSGRSPGGQHGYPFQWSSLENPMDRGAWWATVHWVSKSQTTTEATLHARMDQNEPLKAAWANSSFYWEEIARWSQD